MPSASDSTATEVKPGRLRSMRAACEGLAPDLDMTHPAHITAFLGYLRETVMERRAA